MHRPHHNPQWKRLNAAKQPLILTVVGFYELLRDFINCLFINIYIYIIIYDIWIIRQCLVVCPLARKFILVDTWYTRNKIKAQLYIHFIYNWDCHSTQFMPCIIGVLQMNNFRFRGVTMKCLFDTEYNWWCRHCASIYFSVNSVYYWSQG